MPDPMPLPIRISQADAASRLGPQAGAAHTAATACANCSRLALLEAHPSVYRYVERRYEVDGAAECSTGGART